MNPTEGKTLTLTAFKTDGGVNVLCDFSGAEFTVIEWCCLLGSLAGVVQDNTGLDPAFIVKRTQEVQERRRLFSGPAGEA